MIRSVRTYHYCIKYTNINTNAYIYIYFIHDDNHLEDVAEYINLDVVNDLLQKMNAVEVVVEKADVT